jgi:cell division septation protein DedD
VETANRARFYVQRCLNLPAAARKDSVRTDTVAAAAAPPKTPSVTKTPPAPAASVAKTYAVQVAAVRSVAAADQSMQALKRAGYEPRVARDTDGFFKVRVGSFKTKAEAQKLAADVKRKANLMPFVVEEP